MMVDPLLARLGGEFAGVALRAGLVVWFLCVASVFVASALSGRILRGRASALVAGALLALAGVAGQVQMLREHGSQGGLPEYFPLIRWAVSEMQHRFGLPLSLAKMDGVLASVVLNGSAMLSALPPAVLAASALGWMAGRADSGAGSVGDVLVARCLTGGTVKALYFAIFAAAALAGLVPIVWMSLDVSAAWFQDGAPAYGRSFWIAPCAVSGLLWGAVRPAEPVQGAVPPAADAVPKPAEPDLAALFESYRTDFSPILLHASVARPEAAQAHGRRDGTAPGAATAADRVARVAEKVGLASAGAVVAALGPSLEGVWRRLEATAGEPQDGTALVMKEEMSFLHVLVIAELILAAQDRGTTALVIAPESSIDRVSGAIGAALHALEGSQTQRVFEADDQPAGRYDVVVISLQRLEQEILSSQEASVVEARRRFGLLVLVDLHRLDVALLRLRLTRLSREVEGRNLLAVVQSAPRAGLEGQVRAFLAPLGLEPRRITMPERHATHLYRLIWRNDVETLRALVRTDLGRSSLPDAVVEVAPFTLVRAWKQDVAATFFDLAGRTDRVLWGETVPHYVDLPRARLTHREIVHLGTGHIPYPGREDRVVVIEDLANLVEAARHSGNFMNNGSVLVHIVAHDYPMRDFLRDVLDKEEAEAGAARILHGETFLPIAPSPPRGGPAELALAVADEIRRASGHRVPERVLARCYAEADTGDRLPREAWGDTTRRGLTELLHTQLGYTAEIRVEAAPGHERHFVFRSAADIRLEPSYLLEFRRDASPEQRRIFLDRNDNGVAYIDGSMMPVHGSFVRVGRVEARLVHGQSVPTVGQRLAGEFARNRPTYRFSRLYEPDFTASAISDYRASAAAVELPSLVLLLRGHVTRATVAFHEMPELERPFTAGSTPNWTEEMVRSQMPQAVQILLRLRLDRVAGPPDGAADGPQGGEGQAMSARRAVTLAITLQDVLWSMFPRNGERLAVLSPQAEPAVRDVLRSTEPDTLAIYPAILMPRLSDGLDGTGPDDGPASIADRLLRPPAPRRQAEEQIAAMIRRHRWGVEGEEILSAGAVDRFTRGTFLDLLLIEDASHDLGCLRALFQEENWSAVMTIWTRYVRWCAGRTEAPDFYYRYGSASPLPAILDFAAASTLLDRLTIQPERAR